MSATNVVWNIVIPEIHLSNAPLSKAIDFLEISSSKLDPKGRGVRIVGEVWGVVPDGITFNATNIPFHEAVSMIGMMVGGGNALYLVDDVALFCQRSEGGEVTF